VEHGRVGVTAARAVDAVGPRGALADHEHGGLRQVEEAPLGVPERGWSWV